MSFETDLLLDRRRLRRRLNFWRVLAVLAVLAAVLGAVGRQVGDPGGAHVARLPVNGIITDDRALVAAVTKLAKDDSVKALIVDIDSPGGTVAGGEALHEAIKRVAARKPVVSVMRGTAASAGYMVAVPAARIFAREATLTGSIGVLLQSGEVSGLLASLGITTETITSGPLKDQPSLTRRLTPDGRQVLEGLVADMYDQFLTMVAEGRRMDIDKVRSLADGRAYTGRQALKLGLVDAIGGEAEARDWLTENRDVASDLPVRDVKPDRGLRGWLAPVGEDLSGSLLAFTKSLFHQGLTLDGAWAVWQPLSAPAASGTHAGD